MLKSSSAESTRVKSRAQGLKCNKPKPTIIPGKETHSRMMKTKAPMPPRIGIAIALSGE